jgi:hypothetical protein
MRKNTALLGVSSVFAFGVVCVALSASAAPKARHHAFVEEISHPPNGGVAASTDAIDDAIAAPVIEDSDAGADAGAPFLPYNPAGIDSGTPPVIISQAEVVAVLWGKDVDPTVARSIGTFYSAMVHGAFMHYLSEFATPTQTIGSYGSFLGTFRIAPAQPSGTITDDQIQTELTNQIAQGSLPTPDANTIYMLHFPPEITVQGPIIGGSSIGLSCVDYCGYHYGDQNTQLSSLTYAVIPDQSGGCAPGPVGCDQNPAIHCCGDRTAFDNLTKTAAHELMEAITDPQPWRPAWENSLLGEAADLCNFSKIGENAYTSIIGENGQTFQAQRGFSNSAFVKSLGSPRGCVNFPTTLCCQAPLPTDLASFQPPAACNWIPNGVTSCPTDSSHLTVSLEGVGGFGSGSVVLGNNAPYDGVCFPADRSGTPSFCATVTPAGGLTTEPTALVTAPASSTMPLAEPCYGPPPATGCPAFASFLVNGSCCSLPPTPFVASATTGMETARVAVASVPSIPALPPGALALAGLSLFGIGATRRGRPTSSRRRDSRGAGGSTFRRG